ncbi:hypothetical protein RFI_33651, partial [Reticulomyxa filosa]
FCNLYTNMHIYLYVQMKRWSMLGELPFSSKRKRMTVIFKNNTTGKIHVTIKGADSEMVKLIAGKEENPHWNTYEECLNTYSEEGLRTLVIAEAILNPSWWNEWGPKYHANKQDKLMATANEAGHIRGACGDLCRFCKFYEEMEIDAKVELLGVTAIEDKLQDRVPDTISKMLEANIKVWMLTGDKQKTAENIGIACNLLEPCY